MKRQLHVRMIKSKDEQQMVTFGIFCKDHDLELYVMSFDKNANMPYQLYQLHTLTLPSSSGTYTNMETTLEFLISFKAIMLSTLPNIDNILKQHICHEYSPYLKPTLSFMKN